MHQTLLALHIAAGSLALAIMWIPMLTRKGGRAHRSAGWAFVAVMVAVSTTALLLSARLFIVQDLNRGMLLLYLSALTANLVSSGVRAIRTKERTGAHRHPWDVGLSILVIVTAAGAIWRGLEADNLAVVLIAAPGVYVGAVHLRYWLRAPGSPMHWWIRHMTSMLAACFSAAAAFTTNFDKLGIWPGSAAAIVLLAVVGIPGIAIWVLSYRKRFSVQARSARPSPAAE